MLTLPLMLFIVMMELAVGEFIVLFLLDWRSQVKRHFLVLYGILYVLLTGLTYLFQQNFANADLLNTFALVDKGWTGYLAPLLLLFLLLLLPYNLFLWMDKKAGVDGKSQEGEGKQGFSFARILRMISGGLAALAGAGTLLAVAMSFRTLAPAGIAQILTVAGFFASALALGGVMTAMWLGHWYLVTPALSEKPLLFSTTLVLIGVLAQVIFFLTAGPSLVPASANHATSAAPTVVASPTAGIVGATPTVSPNVKPTNAPVVTPLSTDAIGWLHILVG